MQNCNLKTKKINKQIKNKKRPGERESNSCIDQLSNGSTCSERGIAPVGGPAVGTWKTDQKNSCTLNDDIPFIGKKKTTASSFRIINMRRNDNVPNRHNTAAKERQLETAIYCSNCSSIKKRQTSLTQENDQMV